MKQNRKNDFNGFSKLKLNDRIRKLIELHILSEDDRIYLKKKNKLSSQLAEQLIENSIAYFELPLGVAVNFIIDEREHVIPMAIEETSVIAAASKTAKWIREKGEIVTEIIGKLGIGQIQLAKVKNFEKFKQIIEANKTKLMLDANQNIAKKMTLRGGGVKNIIVRKLKRPDGHTMAVIHLLINTCDAMGANFINQICEYLKGPIETLTKETVNLCILSNLTDGKLTRAKVIMYDIDAKLGQSIEEASLFAKLDPYRAATNNKGALNGMDAVAIATGNDWRALEAGIHAYAARDEHYHAITQWKMQGKNLVGILEAPINIGTIGGVTKIHPTAALCLRMLKISKADELARIIAAVGLVQNLGALKALTREGITLGHMKLHINNLCIAAGAEPSEMSKLKRAVNRELKVKKHITQSDVKEILNEIRKDKI